MNVKVELKNGYFKTNICWQNRLIDSSFKKFIAKDILYREKYLQKKYDYAFDGYSFLGQEDSINQYAEDLLHSFVISDFHSANEFPKEFQNFLKQYWVELINKIKTVELKILNSMKIDNKKDIINFHNQYIGYMMSMNYYPKYDNLKSKTQRLSEHKDVSLLTVFPFGVSDGLKLKNEKGEETNIEPTTQLIAFPGFLLECLTNGKIKAVNHFVSYNDKKNDERYSYAMFSIPLPNNKLPILKLSSESYFKRYLSLF